jgi:hypothetical protein
MRLATGLLLAVALIIGGYTLIERNHIGAPADPYGPCPAGSTYTVFWFRPGQYTQGQGPGVRTYLGWTELASCSGVLHIGVQTQAHPAGQP